MTFLHPLLLELLQRVHLPGGAHLAGAHLAEAALPQDSVQSERVLVHWSFLEELPLQVSMEVHRVEELSEGLGGEERADAPKVAG